MKQSYTNIIKKTMNKEFEFLNIIKNITQSSYLGDDCAYLEDYNLAISSDSLIEDVHFSLKFMTPYEIAQKALLVNVSDILASGASPKYYTINLSGSLDNSFVEEFYKGLNEISKEYNIKLLGGDLTRSQKITISITIFGDYKNRQISSRKNALENYIVAVAGEFGSSAKGLEDLQNGIKDNYFIKQHKKPKLYPNISSIISQNTNDIYAMMDSSDGIMDCLYQISSKSGVRIDVEYSKIPKKIEDKEFVLYGGEDYSLVVCLSLKDFENIKNKCAELVQIGFITSGKDVYLDNKKMEYRSYEHFK